MVADAHLPDLAIRQHELPRALIWYPFAENRDVQFQTTLHKKIEFLIVIQMHEYSIIAITKNVF